MEHRIIVTAALSHWADGDLHGSVVIGGCREDGTPVEETIAVELPCVATCEDLRRYAKQVLWSLVAEL